MNKVIYETGATSHAVNDLILFTDNTRELAELRNRIYTRFLHWNRRKSESRDNEMYVCLIELFNAAKSQYIKEFRDFEDNKHIRLMPIGQMNEYLQLYIDDFENWKAENQ